MKIAYFDCFCGAAGDMIVGACLDAGAPEKYLREELNKLGLTEVRLHIEKVIKKGISATSYVPQLSKGGRGHVPHRHLTDIMEIINKADLSETVKLRACAIFDKLARAEAKVHGTGADEIHFHEVGAADAIMDIVGACVVLESLGIEKVYCSALAVGSGTIRCEHGTLPVPAPATAELIKGIEIRPCPAQGELLTPTGAAILTSVAQEFGPIPSMSIESIGYGAGTRDLAELPNVLRIFVGQTCPEESPGLELDQVVLLETNLDDVSGEIIGYTTELLLQAGALDVYCTSISMKKNRPATQLSVICRWPDVSRLEEILFRQSTTFGIRRHICQRSVLTRDYVTVKTPYGEIRIKVGYLAREPITYAAEYEDCQKLAQEHKIPVKEVMAAALAAYKQINPNHRSG